MLILHILTAAPRSKNPSNDPVTMEALRLCLGSGQSWTMKSTRDLQMNAISADFDRHQWIRFAEETYCLAELEGVCTGESWRLCSATTASERHEGEDFAGFVLTYLHHVPSTAKARTQYSMAAVVRYHVSEQLERVRQQRLVEQGPGQLSALVSSRTSEYSTGPS